MYAPDEMSMGEMGRSLKRIEGMVGDLQHEMRDGTHRMKTDIQGQVESVVKLKVMQDVMGQDLNNLGTKMREIDGRVQAVDRKAAAMSGGVAVLAMIGNGLVAWFLKH